MAGLTLPGIGSLVPFATGEITPTWLTGVGVGSRLIGDYTLLNLTTGIKKLTNFYFRTPRWPIDGVYFDGIMRTDHNSSVRLTDFPVQNGSIGTDHAVIQPSELFIEIMMSDANTFNSFGSTEKLNDVYEMMRSISSFSNYIEMDRDMQGIGRSAAAYTILRCMQLSRKPLSIETRLNTYNNMILVNLSAPDDVRTLNALRCNCVFREIITVGVPETKVSKRPEVTDSGGNDGTKNAKEPSNGSFLHDNVFGRRVI